MHGFEHLIAHVLVLIVQLGDVSPIVLNHQITQTVPIMPAFVLGPLTIRRCMVGNPVEDYLEAHLVCLAQKMFKVRARTELRVDGAVVNDGIVTAQRVLTRNDTNRLTWHHPNDINAVLFEGRQQTLCCSKRAFRCGLTGVQLLDGRVIRPFRV